MFPVHGCKHPSSIPSVPVHLVISMSAKLRVSTVEFGKMFVFVFNSCEDWEFEYSAIAPRGWQNLALGVLDFNFCESETFWVGLQTERINNLFIKAQRLEKWSKRPLQSCMAPD